MQKNTSNITKRDTIKAARIIKVAEITGFSQRVIQKVLAGDYEFEQTNEEVLRVYMTLAEEENLLIQRVNQLVPL